MSDAPREGLMSAEQIASRHGMAEMGIQRARRGEALAEVAATATNVEVATGEKPARLHSKAANGFTNCQRHGEYCRIVDSATGLYVNKGMNGVCEFCWREEADPARLRRRSKEEAVRAAADADRLEIEARAARMRAEELAADAEEVSDGKQTG